MREPLIASEVELNNYTLTDLIKENINDIIQYKGTLINKLNENIILQLPKLHIHEITNSYIELELKESKQKHNDLIKMFDKLIKNLCLEISKNSKKWFNKELDVTTIQSMFENNIK